MSLLMQALRKAERARVQNGHEAQHPEHVEPQYGQDDVPSPLSMEGGPAFSVMPEAWRLEPLNSEPPVMAAQEAAHDPVPPQARHEARHEAQRDPQRGPEPGFRQGAAVRAGLHSATPSRAVASSQRRLMLLVGALLGLLLLFAFVYWRAVSGPGPGARLPMVPMPAAGLPQAAQEGALAGAGIPVAPYVTSADVGATPPSNLDAVPGVAPAAAVQDAMTGRAGLAAPATQPNVDVTIPTPEQLAAITDPAIRAEAMRDAAERAARHARNDVRDVAPGSIGAQDEAAKQYGIAVSGRAPAASAASVAPGSASADARRGAVGGAGAAATAPPKSASTQAGSAGARQARGATGSRHTLQTAVGENGDVRFVKGAANNTIAPAVQNGYNALKSGDLATARQQYDLALLQDPNNRDALLGAAAVAQREGDGRQATNNYLRLLELDPNDPEALAALAELRNGDLEANEVKLKGIARRHPDSGPVQFALGNLLARQGRWPEAQQSYFRAYSAMPDNADYAFNLGVGLDRMNQPRLAQTYYRRALELAQASPPAFNVEAARKRLQALETPPQ